MASEFRQLTSDETTRLEQQLCSCPDWSQVRVARDFEVSRVRATHFSGPVTLGSFQKEVTLAGGVKKPSGITGASIHNCRIGENVYINNVGGRICNYVIEDEVVIENVGLMAVEGARSFGNGVNVAAINEAGGREIPIYDNLSAQLAYIMTLYRHRSELTEKLGKMIADYTESVTSSMGVIGRGAVVRDCPTVVNVRLGPGTIVEAATCLENGSINSCPEDPVYVGPGVIARDFILCSGSRLTDGATIEKCFVGQGCLLAGGFSAENSLFFANCQCLHGEACSVFAGPYTVTHHKSTLLIAGVFSFFNAGSGTNQSNHMYKLGPVHQGILERGVKTASDSYMLWPARVGAFSVVVGKHYSRPDTTDFPFSYLMEEDGRSVLAPGTNLRKTGLVRDAKKWGERDARKDPRKLDEVNPAIFSPYTAEKMLKGLELLERHAGVARETSECFVCPGTNIKAAAVENGIRYYRMAIDEYVGACLARRLAAEQLSTTDELRAALSAGKDLVARQWVDLAGLYAPKSIVEEMLERIEHGDISSLEEVQDSLKSIADRYDRYQWAWVAGAIEQTLGKKPETVCADDVIGLLDRWKSAFEKAARLHIADAEKEYSEAVRVGYGIDGDERTRDADFEAVRGRLEQSDLAGQIHKSLEENTKLYEQLIGKLKALA